MQTWPQTWLLGGFTWPGLATSGRSPRAAQPAFDAALKRRLPGDETNDAAAAALPTPAAAPLQAAAVAPRWSPQAVAEPHAALRQWQVQAEQTVEPTTNRWQLQLLDSTLPVQQLDVQRTPAGTLQVVIGTSNADALRPLHTERLRLRLAARGETAASVQDMHGDAPASSSSTEQELP